jgi:hypothetical protein
MGYFVVLIGGPGTFESCDPAHDKNWINYFRPIQIATEREKGSDSVKWVVYEPAYEVRWLDDSEITFGEWIGTISDRSLHNTRKGHADKVKAAKATNYLHFVQSEARRLGAEYKGIRKPQEFWDWLGSLSPNSVSRVWYSGHAAPAGLFLQLTHDNSCRAVATADGLLTVKSISDHAHLRDRFITNTKAASKFYGCNTAEFAKVWHDTFAVPAEGAASKITFDGIFNDPKGVLKGLETTPTSSGDPKWSKY